jgi:hypothetical protein
LGLASSGFVCLRTRRPVSTHADGEGWAGLAGLALLVRIRSRSTSARPPSTASTKRPVLVPVSAHGSTKDRDCALASTMRLTMPTVAVGSAAICGSETIDERGGGAVAGTRSSSGVSH